MSATGSGWNTALGYQAGKSITLGTQNTIIGKDVGSTTLMTGAGNILIGTSSTVDTSASASNNQINIGGAIEANNSTLAVSLTAPTVLAACTSPSVTASNGTWGFAFNVGTSCIGISTATLAIPAAAHGWTCNLVAVTAPDTRYVAQTGGTASTVTLKSVSRATGAGTAFADSDVVRGSCLAY